MKKQLFFTIALFCSSVLSFGQYIGENFYQNGDNRIYYNTTSLSPLTVSVGTSFTFNLTDVVIPATVSYNGNNYAVTGILNQGFQNRTTLTSISIPDSVTKIGENAFYNCNNLNVATISNTSQLNIIDYQAFYACNYLTSINIPDSITQINESAFQGCTSLASVTISNSNSLTNISAYAFRSCSSLTSFTIPNLVTTISESAFEYCTGLTSITIPNLVTSIGNDAFGGCAGLTSVSIGTSVTNIGEGTFYGCTGLTSITIPNSVTSIGQYAFQSCSGLTSLTVNWVTPLVVNANVFENLDTSIIKLYVPTGTANAYEADAVWTNFIILEPLAASQSQINATCFGGNTGQAEIIITNGVAPYTFTWSNGGTTALQTALTDGTYNCIVTDTAMNSITLTFTITQPDQQPYNVTTVTECGSYEWFGTVYTTSGIKTGTTTNCVTEKLNLTIIPNTDNITTISACDSYTWNGTMYNESGLYVGNTDNCVTEKLNLAITPSTTLTQANQACISYTWPANGETYTESGTYTAVNGCQTTIMNLTINQPVTVNFTETACDSYFWSRNEATYTTSGTYTFVSGCLTSILNLTITPSTTNTTTVSAVGNYIFNGEIVSTTLIGYEFPNGNCNTEILNLTIIPATVTITNENGVLTSVTNAPNATYQWYNCITEQNIAGQTSATYTPTQSGSYNVIIRINGVLSASAGCFNFTFLANNTFSGIAGLDIYPNPSTGIFNLKLPTDLQIEIYNNLGQLLSSEKMLSGSNVINIADKPVGIYFLKANDGNNVSTFKIIKN